MNPVSALVKYSPPRAALAVNSCTDFIHVTASVLVPYCLSSLSSSLGACTKPLSLNMRYSTVASSSSSGPLTGSEQHLPTFHSLTPEPLRDLSCSPLSLFCPYLPTTILEAGWKTPPHKLFVHLAGNVPVKETLVLSMGDRPGCWDEAESIRDGMRRIQGCWDTEHVCRFCYVIGWKEEICVSNIYQKTSIYYVFSTEYNDFKSSNMCFPTEVTVALNLGILRRSRWNVRGYISQVILHNLVAEVPSRKAHRATDSGGVMRLSVILQLNSLWD